MIKKNSARLEQDFLFTACVNSDSGTYISYRCVQRYWTPGKTNAPWSTFNWSFSLGGNMWKWYRSLQYCNDTLESSTMSQRFSYSSQNLTK